MRLATGDRECGWRLRLATRSSTAAPGFAQTTGAIYGHVHDVSGAAVARAKVLVRDALTGARRESPTDDAGRFLAPDLYPGVFQVSVAASGFQEQFRGDIAVNAAGSVRVDFTLQLGVSREIVEVKEETPLLDPDANSKILA